MTARKAAPVKDAAGLDQVLMAAGKGVARFLESAAQKRFGVPLNLWDGPDGLGAVLQEHLDAAGVPNRRALDLLTPRSVLKFATRKKARLNRRRAG